MKYIVIIFWALVLGQVVGYIASSLAQVTQIPILPTAVLSLIVAGIVIAIQKIGIEDET